MTTSKILIGVVAVLLAASQALAQTAAAPRRSIERVSGDVYTASNNNHRTVFLVTPEGIILADPINADFSKWIQPAAIADVIVFLASSGGGAITGAAIPVFGRG